MCTKEQFIEFLKKKNIDDEKIKAITAWNENVLLSAGAGCGKTFTLTYRVIFQILVKGLSIDQMLIITFTNNAANEMKERIGKTLNKLADDIDKGVPELSFLDAEVAERLRAEAAKSASATICTFDSFCSQIVRKYADVLNIDPAYTNISETAENFIFDNFLDEKLNDEYKSLNEGNNKRLEDFYNICTARDGSFLKSFIESIKKAREHDQNLDGELADYKNKYASTSAIENIQMQFTNMVIEKIKWYIHVLVSRDQIVKPQQEAIASNSQPFFPALIEFLEEKIREWIAISHADDRISRMRSDLDCISFTGCKPKKGESENLIHPNDRSWWKNCYGEVLADAAKKNFKDPLDKIVSSLENVISTTAQKDYDDDIAKLVAYAYSIEKSVEDRLQSFKAEHNCYTFSDIKLKCIQLLRDNLEIRAAERFRIKSIMVDEYQDSDHTQEEMLRILGTEEKEYKDFCTAKNPDTSDTFKLFSKKITFMVGDVKQSIYRFRGAVPQLFLDKYSSKPKKYDFTVIAMKKNFRSSQDVIDQTNQIFKKLMTPELGGVDYENDSNQQLIMANEILKGKAIEFDDTSLKLFETPKKKYQRDIATAEMVAEKIDSLVKSKKIIYPSKKEGEKAPISYGSFAILIDKKKKLDFIIHSLSKRNIPFTIKINTNMTKTIVAITAASLLKLESILLKAKRNKGLLDKGDISGLKRSVASIERSFIFQRSDAQVIQDVQKINNSIRRINELKDNELIRFIDDRVNKLIDPNLTSPIEIFRLLCNSFDFTTKISTLNNTEKNFEAFEWFYLKVQELSDLGQSLSTISEFFSSGAANNEEIETTAEYGVKDGNGAVTIINVHKSKGLEYPIVILPFDVSSSSKNPNESSSVTFDSNLGFILNEDKLLRCVTNPDSKSIFLPQCKVFKYKDSLENASEFVRLYYVAVTRAINSVIFIAPGNTEKAFLQASIAPNDRLNYGQVILRSTPDIRFTFDSSLDKQLKDNTLNNWNIFTKVPYPVTTDITGSIDVPSNTISTHTKGQQSSKSRASSGTHGVATLKDEIFGTTLHKYLELLNWDTFPKKPLDSSFIKDKEAHRIVDRFIRSKLIQDLVKESQNGSDISFYPEWSYLDPDTETEGRIDLLILKNLQSGHPSSIIVDYKTKRLDDQHYDNQLKVYQNAISKLKGIPLDDIQMILYSLTDGRTRQVK